MSTLNNRISTPGCFKISKQSNLNMGLSSFSNEVGPTFSFSGGEKAIWRRGQD